MAAELGGLLKYEFDLRLYDAACGRAKPEWTTGQFWMRILQEQFPPADGYSLAPEVPPAEGSGKRVDMGRAAKDSPGGRRVAEKQVLEYCELYLKANPNQSFMHAMVCAGPHATIWKVLQNPKTVDQEEDTEPEPEEPHIYTDAKAATPNPLSQGFEDVRRSRP